MYYKKGFTLIEIIISISIILIVCTTALSLNLYKKHQKYDFLDALNDEILTAINVYINTNNDIKSTLYNNKSGLIIPLSTLQNSGLIDFGNINITEDDYVITMLGTPEETADRCAETYTTKSWDIRENETIYICEKENTTNINSEVEKKIDEMYYAYNIDKISVAGADPNNYALFALNASPEYFIDDDNKDIWRILSYKNDTIKLAYNQKLTLSSSTDFKEILSNSDLKNNLYNEIVNQNWMKETLYYYLHQTGRYRVAGADVLASFTSSNVSYTSYVGHVNHNDYNEVLYEGNWLPSNFVTGIYTYAGAGSLTYSYDRKLVSNRGAASYQGDSSTTGGDFVPVVTLKSNIKIKSFDNCVDGTKRGSKECPYEFFESNS